MAKTKGEKVFVDGMAEFTDAMNRAKCIAMQTGESGFVYRNRETFKWVVSPTYPPDGDIFLEVYKSGNGFAVYLPDKKDR